MLNEQSCLLFQQPFFQFSQIKRYCPERIEPLKAEYREQWAVWRETVNQVAEKLGEPFAPPHIERWCNGWQVRAHFFAFFKYEAHSASAPIFSLILNRRRLTVALDWHAYKAASSPLPLQAYQAWADGLNTDEFAGFEIWRGSDSEYADHLHVAAFSDGLALHDKQDFYRIGRHLEGAEWAKHDVAEWIAETVRRLQPLYERCFE
ncbi:MAG: HI_0552 family protein [Neisseria sp.]|nr:HI_0552 family protein [Neisseria sp.]